MNNCSEPLHKTKVRCAYCIVEELCTPPFTSLGQALSFYNLYNPARAKSVNINEKDRGGTDPESLKGHYPPDVWASTALAIKAVLKDKSIEARRIFYLRDIGDRSEAQKSKEEIAQILGISLSKVKKQLYKIYDELEDELKRRELLMPQLH